MRTATLRASIPRTPATKPDPVADGLSALRRCVGDAAGFECAWGARPLHVPRSDPAAFADIFGMDAADELVSSAVRTPVVRMVENGTPLAPTRYCTATRLGGRHLDDVVDPAKVAARLNEGVTLVLQSLHRVWPTVADFVGALQDEIGHPVQANAYLTPPAAAGLAPHADAHDVIVLQLAGTKSWTVDGLGTLPVAVGDSMYLPAGVTHSAQTGDDFSLHLTLGIIRVTQRDLIERALATADGLDAPVPVGFRSGSPAALRHTASEALGAAMRQLEEIDLDELAEREQRRRLAPPMIRGRVSSMMRSSSITGATVVRWVAPQPRVRPAAADDQAGSTSWMPVEVWPVDDGGRVDVHVGGRVLTMPGAAIGALADLACAGRRRVDDLPGLDAPSRVVVVRRLVQESVCVIDAGTPTFGAPTSGTPAVASPND